MAAMSEDREKCCLNVRFSSVSAAEEAGVEAEEERQEDFTGEEEGDEAFTDEEERQKAAEEERAEVEEERKEVDEEREKMEEAQREEEEEVSPQLHICCFHIKMKQVIIIITH